MARDEAVELEAEGGVLTKRNPVMSTDKPDVRTDDPVLPFNDSMERTSIFIPAYMNHLLSMVAMKENVGKATVIRNAILRELLAYIEDIKTNDGGNKDSTAYESIHAADNAETKDRKNPAVDFESHVDWVKEIYEEFATFDEKFPQRVQLHHRRRQTPGAK